jgi:hypothetical protein
MSISKRYNKEQRSEKNVFKRLAMSAKSMTKSKDSKSKYSKGSPDRASSNNYKDSSPGRTSSIG